MKIYILKEEDGFDNLPSNAIIVFCYKTYDKSKFKDFKKRCRKISSSLRLKFIENENQESIISELKKEYGDDSEFVFIGKDRKEKEENQKLSAFKEKRFYSYLFIALIVGIFIIYLACSIFLSGKQMDYDQVRNSLIIRSIANNGRFSFLESAYYKHSFLMFYILAVPQKIFGSELSLVIAVILFSIATLVINFYFFKKLFDYKTAFITTLLLAFSSTYFTSSFRIMFDLFTVFFFIIAMYFFWLSFKTGKTIYWILAGVFTGLSMLIKAPLGIIYAAMLIFAFIFPVKDFEKKSRRFIMGVVSFLCCLATYAPWELYMKINNGGYDWIKEMQLGMGWQQGAVPDPIYAYFTQSLSEFGIFFLGVIFVFFVLFGTYFIVKKSFKERNNFEEIFLLLIFMFVNLFFLIYPIKEFRFLLPAFPIGMYFSYVGILESSKIISSKVKIKHLHLILIGVVLILFATASIGYISEVKSSSFMGGGVYLKEADSYLKLNGISSCIASDERLLCPYFIKNCCLWIQNDSYSFLNILDYNVSFVVSHDMSLLSEPVVSKIKSFGNYSLYVVNRSVLVELLFKNQSVVKITGKLSDSSGRPLDGLIGVYSGENHVADSRIDSLGNFIFYVPSGSYNLVVYSWGYQKEVVPIDTNSKLFFEIKMNKESFMKNGLDYSAW